jgi:hypothetical protein
MTNNPNIKFYDGVWQRELSLFNHYSTVRMTLLAFLIPLGGLMIIQSKIAAGTLVIAVAYFMNLYFGAVKALSRWLVHMNIDLWREIGDVNSSYDSYRQDRPGIWWFLFGSLKDYKFKDPLGDGKWKEKWKVVLARARGTEFFLQVCVIAGILVFYTILVC